LKKKRAISLFSGCGGSDFALLNAGFDVVWANDSWGAACQTYRDNIPNPKIHEGDIRDFERFPTADILAGCYPCQGYSQGGRRDPDESINFLYRQFDRVLRIVRPKTFVVENVNGMAYGANRQLLNNQLCRFRLAGYNVSWQVLNALNFGVPQSRRRVFLVGLRSDLDAHYTFPQASHGPGTGRVYPTQFDAIRRMPKWPEGEFNEEAFHWYYLSRNRRHTWKKPSPCIVGHWRHVPLHPMSPPLRRIDTDHWRFARNGRARRLSYRECARLQGFPASFTWKRGTIRERFQMIGNAVPPPLFEAVVRDLTEICD
jgi:DNA (cytosine-5)-methyltransferase 1